MEHAKYYTHCPNSIHRSINCLRVNGKKSFLDKNSSDHFFESVNTERLGIIEYITWNKKDHQIIFYSKAMDATLSCNDVAFMIQFTPILINYNEVWNRLNAL